MAVRDGTEDSLAGQKWYARSLAGQRWYARLACWSEMLRKTRLRVRDGTQDSLVGQRWYARQACGSEISRRIHLGISLGLDTKDSFEKEKLQAGSLPHISLFKICHFILGINKQIS